MSFNPMKLVQVKPLWSKFRQDHPDFMAFLKKTADESLKKGSVIKITVTDADGRVMSSEVELSQDDIKFADTVKEVF